MVGIDWPEVLVGFLLGLVPLVARQLYILINYMRTSGRRKYLGVWWTYHRSTTGSGKIIERRVHVRYSLMFDRLTLREKNDPEGGGGSLPLTYSGHISPRQGMVRYVETVDEASHERKVWFLFDPFFDPVEQTVGIYLSLDLRGLPSAGPMMLSRKRVPREQVDSMLNQHVLRVAELLPAIDH
ncbi:hypothetical protein [Micromonospora sp. Mcm103]|uniref:hypothetical protein n=1 Tax=Micromonospora sp. Mcm103 TaxID=2926015 RepID=UPI0021C643DA|nr:hypothetical protein [Micromonospora sp. Mcm103]